MPRYLITLSIGPVQDFIAAARRTRDLWFGSHLLSEISKAAAKHFYDERSDLIFPAPLNPKLDLQPRDDQLDVFSVGNKLLISATTDTPLELINSAKSAATKRWKKLAKKALKEVKTKHSEFNIRENIWNKQLDDVLEFFSAWVLFEKDEDYTSSRERLEELLNARKNSRNFLASPITDEGHGLPKSSLDGLRETVLKKEMLDWQKRKLNLSAGEQLDCQGLIKRLGGDPEQFTPISRIALDPWLRGLKNQERLSDLFFHMEKLKKIDLVSTVKGNDDTYNDFPYDGQMLYPFRLEVAPAQINRENGIPAKEKEIAKKKIKELKEAINKLNLYSKYGEPSPYLAILAADGDRMGELLDNMQTLSKHQSISQKLAQFSTHAPTTIRKYRGHCIYAGGDDVLALVPLDHAVECAKALSKNFNKTLSEIEEIPLNKIPTLSVGIGIGHFMEPMGRLLDLARQAESLAKSNHLSEKQQKNALGIILKPRSGAAIEFRERWENSPEKILKQWVDAHINDLFSTRTAYDMREEHHQLQWSKNHPALIKAETRRILDRKRTENGTSTLDKSLIESLCKRSGEIGLGELSTELILTQHLAKACQQAINSKEAN